MATHSFHTLHHPSSLHRRLSIDTPSSSSFFLTPTTTATTSTHPSISSSAFSLSSSSSPTSQPHTLTQQPPLVSLDLLLDHLAAQNFRQADEESRRLLIALAGSAAQKRGYVFFSEVKFIAEADLKAIDELWRRHSGGRFGYSVQKRAWEKAKRDFTSFFIKVGWMKKLVAPTEDQVVQFNYKAFPEEFMWELSDATPEGHLPLTNCLRGTQLLSSILNHPAFDEPKQEEGEGSAEKVDGLSSSSSSSIATNGKPLVGKRLFKPSDYSF